MGHLPRPATSLLSIFTLGNSLPEIASDEVWLLQLPDAKVAREHSKSRRDPLQGLESPELHRYVGLVEDLNLQRFQEPHSRGSSSEPWFFSHPFDELPFGSKVAEDSAAGLTGAAQKVPSARIKVPSAYSDFDDAPLWLTTSNADNDMVLEMMTRKKDPVTWPLLDNSADTGDYGRILKKVNVNISSGTFALQTVHGMHLNIGANLSVFANASAMNESQQLFRFVPLPFSPKQVLWHSEGAGCCVKAESTGGLVLERLQPNVELAPFMFEVYEEEGYLTLHSNFGFVVAGLDSRLLAMWRSRTYPFTPFELGDHLERRFGHVIPPGRAHGVISGITITCLCSLTAYNIRFAATSKATSAASTRLGTFDVVRFVLESLVLHLHLGIHNVYHGWHSQFMTAYRMPAFVFVAGMFGSSMTYESLSKLLCCTLGTTAIIICLRVFCTCIFFSPEVAWSRVVSLDVSAVAGDYWFLVMLAFCRVFVTPIFYAAKTYTPMRRVVPFVVAKLASYFLMHKAARFDGWIFGQYNWHSALAFMPYFALGLLLTPTEWDALLRRRRVQLACLGYFILWYLLQMSPAILQWNHSFCLPRRQAHGCRAHFDIGQIVDPITLELFLLDMAYFALRCGITISFVCMVVVLSEVLGYFSPYLIELMSGWGSRTLYAYTIQQFCLAMLTSDGKFFNHLSSVPDPCQLVLELFLPVFVNIVFSSRGTEHLFRWMLLPYWMKDVGENPHIIDYPRWVENKAMLAEGASKLAAKASARISAVAASAWAQERS